MLDVNVTRRDRLVPAAVAAAEAELSDRLRHLAESPTSASGRRNRREALADYYTRIGHYLNALSRDPVVHKATPPAPPAPPSEISDLRDTLTPRPREVLDRLLDGDSEKQAARHLGISQHTVHDHVKLLYKTFNVASRGELLAKFIRG